MVPATMARRIGCQEPKTVTLFFITASLLLSLGSGSLLSARLPPWLPVSLVFRGMGLTLSPGPMFGAAQTQTKPS